MKTESRKVEAEALKLYKESPEKANSLLTAFSDSVSNTATARYRQLGEYLFVKYLDGRVKKEKDGKFERTADGYPVSPDSPGYSEDYYRTIVRSDGDRLRVKEVKPQ